MKKILLTALFGFLLISLNAQSPEPNGDQEGYTFTTDTEVRCTPVKDQGHTGTCWSFSTASFLESEVMRLTGDSVDLSEMYVVYNVYRDKAQNYVRRQGKANFGEGALSHDLINMIDDYGIVPEEAYTANQVDEQYNHSELVAALKGMLDGIIRSSRLSPYWEDAVTAVLDVYMGKIPENFTYNGSKYTPESFADKVKIEPDNYITITSFTHHPFYKPFILEIPDNYSNGTYYNVPLDELVSITDHAIENGYSVTWDCDVSEKTFSYGNAVAVVPQGDASAALESPQEELTVTQEERQAEFDSYATTDDHLMHITGMAHDQNGTRYYLTKNSWGETNIEGGYLYASEAYFRLKTISVMVHKDAISKSMARKLGITN